uniref:Starch debranching enzyme n=1 Tax=Oryza sativa TaxID=4530 RepID=P93416_ORYSA|nr:starch debranching enzyme precursor [Oryza sativa]
MQMLLHANSLLLLAPTTSRLSASASPGRSGTARPLPPPQGTRIPPAPPLAGHGGRPPSPQPRRGRDGVGEECAAAVASQGFVTDARAYWVTRSLIAWNVNDQDTSLFLYASRDATMHVSDGAIHGYDSKIELEPEHASLPDNVAEKFPFIRSYRTFRVPSSVDVASLVKCQLAVASYDAHGRHQDVTGLQLPGVLDDMFAYTGPLGAVFSDKDVDLYLWAPTAQDVRVCFYDGPAGPLLQTVQLKELNGVWSVTVPRYPENQYYLYEVKVYHPSTSQVEKCLADDPYARGLSANGTRTWLVDINSETLKPASWDELSDEEPNLESFSDISIYELHIRDFSAHDSTVDCNSRGGFVHLHFRLFRLNLLNDFCSPPITKHPGRIMETVMQDSAGIRHLRKLSAAGLTHVHLLPSFHFASVDDNKSNWKFVDEAQLAKLPPGSDEQQAAIVSIQQEDPYNWGYDPVLWGVPKGSYASNPDGPSRIIEYRQMVQALNRIGLRVVMDVVYNHLDSSGPFGVSSVLDKIVPGYYLRRNVNGQIENSAAMNNTASEHFMVDRLTVDDLLNWAINYKVDGFRFDLMGHIMKSTMIRAKSAIRSLTRDVHGVYGSKIYLYGEGWDFGEVAQNKRGINASQINMSGTGIGSFNDRIRDSVNGGNPFGNPLQQGFSTGLFLEPNGYYQGNEADTRRELATYADHIQIGLAGNLKDYVLRTHTGEAKKGSDIYTFDGSPVGYTSSPVETINYVSAHDNETLFDIVSIKTPIGLSIDGECRINHLASSMIALSQGIPFFHAGDEILRSKSLDRDSYNSGDWFKKLDLHMNQPIGCRLLQEIRMKNMHLIKPRLENPSFRPLKNHILSCFDNFVDILKIRYSSPLFRLSTASDIEQRVRFHNTGPSMVPGVIVMSIKDAQNEKCKMAQLDKNFSYVVTIFNVCPHEVSIEIHDLASLGLELHPIQVNSSDALVRQSAYEASKGRFTVPRRTTAVFVQPRC